MPKSLADGHIKLTILTTEPEDPANPTVTELNAGIDVSCNVLASDFTWSAGDSDKFAEAALCESSNANSMGRDNFTAGITLFRYFDVTTGEVDETEDAAYQALKVKGTTAWGYSRENGKEATEPWAEGDEYDLGLRVLTDRPQRPGSGGGYIKRRIPLEPQAGWQEGTVAAAGV
ncbi:hypothetical protein ABKW28_12795 [Nocardioides sp. 31GB23]|uniref:phage tail tube protein n=1 Tax=Nocardioides sp. 31GB23 TaxID=3156065 RepID=UPI0032AF4693